MSAEQIIDLKKTNKQETPILSAAHVDEPLISWEARDHVPQERPLLWHAGILVVAGALALWALWTFNFLFALFVVATVVALFAASSRQPQAHRIEVFPAGIEIEGLPRLNFSEVESFWIFPESNPPLLSLRPRRHIKFPTYLLLENVDAEKVREILLNYIPEREEEFPFFERINRWLGF